MNNEVLIKAEGVSKKFCRNLKRSLWYGLKDIGSELFGLERSDQLRKEEFWAVNDLNFELRRGECLGLIGHNGAGKSTLLKILNGLIKPDRGMVTMKGRIGALIELGSGFNPILTGRENIYNNGAVLGFSKKEIDQKFDEIVEFSEIGEFIDTPVQNYSSGMKVRLGFAVAAQLEPDVLLIDEVLAVGDVGFRSKCLSRINDLLNNAAVIFVSHAMNQISRVSSDIILMDKGKLLYGGKNISKGIELYYDKFGSEKLKKIGDSDAIDILKFDLRNSDRHDSDVFKFQEEITVSMSFKSKLKASDYYIMFSFFDKELKGIALCSSEFQKIHFAKDQNNEIMLEAIIPNHFAPGSYVINVHFIEANGKETKFGICTYQAIRSFQVVGDLVYTQIPIQLFASWNSKQLKKEN